MFDWIDRLREKPEHVRLKVALVIAGIVTAIIAFVWLSILSLDLTQDTSSEGGELTGVHSGTSPFRALGEFFAETGDRFSESWSDLRSLEYEVNTPAEDTEGQEETL